MQVFAKFVFISGIGWLLDFLTFFILSGIFDFSPVVANFISSMVGVTYVWLVSLERLFMAGRENSFRFLILYWGYQALSIFLYSILIGGVAMNDIRLAELLGWPVGIVAKILVTPINLVTNFLFMKFLTSFMRKVGG